MSSTAQQLIGRDDELGAIERLLDARDDLPGTVVLHGQAGIGKTALWLAGIDAASARGYLILSSRPSEAETQFSFGGLTDLLGGVAGAVLPELPPIQQRALEAALLLGESEVDVDDRAVAAAFLAALRVLARDSPLCLAVDDVQWLDAASRTTLGYALGRLDSEPVATLLAVRGEAPEWLRRAASEERMERVDVEGLSIGATQELLRARLDATFPRPTLIRLWETSGGNPVLRARARERAPAPRRQAHTGRPVADPLDARGAPTRATRRPCPGGARGRARGGGPRGADHRPRGRGARSALRCRARRGARRADPRAGRNAVALHPPAPRIRGHRTSDPLTPPRAERTTLRCRLVLRGTSSSPRARHGRRRRRRRCDPRGGRANGAGSRRAG